ncbi:MAG: Glycerol-3-phosphate acyltransferase [Bacteroidia bacterium]|nr:Glycerol-3-phosphate acyltransferase [Bacteroidia bacterium]
MSEQKHTRTGWLYEPLFPDIRTWPIYQLTKDRDAFLKQVKEAAFNAVKEQTKTTQGLNEELAKTYYLERIRVKTNAWAADKKDEGPFWEGVKKKLLKLSPENEKTPDLNEDKILESIIDRYTEEIAGFFSPAAYNFAKEATTFGFARLLNASEGKGISRFWKTRHNLHEKIRLQGELEQIRSLAKKGTLIMVPTHFSNLDSILIGWAIQSLGLRPFLYGAGLNLFGIGILAFFMSRLGAYKVDRRKKNMIYLETLKTYSTIGMLRGCNSLFFPGGTRSRSGAIETKLKLGLLGTAMEAQRLNFLNNPEKPAKLFVVPVVFNYNFVLEAPSLIDEHLKRTGQQHYFRENDDYSTSYKMAKFMIKFFTKSSEMSISFGKCIDLFGNPVDNDGNSIGKNGEHIDIKRYFMTNGVFTRDPQRDAEYTKMLGDEIVKRFHSESRVFASHLVAFVGFELIRKRYKKLDIYAVLRLPEEDQKLTYLEFTNGVSRLLDRLREMAANGEVHLYHELEIPEIDTIIETGLKNLGMYDAKRPLYKSKDGFIMSEDFNLLFFYHNRLEGYGLAKYI